MSQQVLLALMAFAFVTSVTPGPNNLMLMASGANFGLRRTLPHMLGVALGFGVMVLVLGLGVGRILDAAPGLALAMKALSLGYMLWLAWKIAHAAAPESTAGATGRPMRFLAACAFQWVNPKAWMMGLGALSAYSGGAGGTLMVALVFVAVNLPSVAIWAAMGQGLRGALQDPARLRLFNRTMAVLLVASMLPVLSGH
ncbi:LysE family translocator [Paracoccus limosus]|uniref:LysE family translocator n=1 Tax=Paracoccus limosus TaxID=913252 RepID=A0A844H2M2_9RHOB|nr:LysE family translocator [Paracoccus limosus]MTH35082.1 LysE family translocator [Paracoccus limosus]